MSKVTVCGIKNCDTMKKAFTWLDKHKVAYDFHDYKKTPPDAALLKQAIKTLGWETVINRKGTTWRALPDKVKDGMDAKSAVDAALENPSVIKRPLIVTGDKFYAGFDEQDYKKLFG